MKTLWFLALGSCFLCVYGQETPCENKDYTTISQIGFRYVNYVIDHTYEILQDAYLKSGWYYVGQDPMPESAPGNFFVCGTKFPIYLQGNHPTNSTPVVANACQQSVFGGCDYTYQIQIANCGDFYLYYLRPTQGTDSAYCFGIGVEGSRTSFEPQKPAVSGSLEDRIENGNQLTRTVILCEFAESTDSLVYVVSWYQNGKLQYRTPAASSSTDRTCWLTEEEFVDKKFEMGNNVSCTVTAFTVADGPPSKTSERSEEFFVGIEVLTPSISFAQGETDKAKRTIRLRLTVPFGCALTSECAVQLSTYQLNITVNNRGKCNSLGFGSLTSCGVRIKSSDYNDELELVIQDSDTNQYRATEEFYEILLKTETAENRIWKNYELPSIQVHIGAINSQHQGKVCLSRNDPHIKTFDKRHLDNHQSGTFVLYKHLTMDTEIQIRFKPCGRRGIKCNCGVAVRQGFDVFIIDLCNSEWKIQYEYCGAGEHILEVRAISDRNYEIYFTYGTFINVYWYGWYSMTVYVYPSSQDAGAASIGLCGTLDGDISNDFRLVNGTDYISSINGWGTRNQPIPFIDNMRVSEEKDLFSQDFDTNNLTPWTSHLCVCPNSSVAGNKGTSILDGNIPCYPSGVIECRKTGKPVRGIQCNDSSRRRRSIKRKSFVPYVTITNQHIPNERLKRQTSSNWTRESATEYCTAQISGSSAYTLCQDVPSADTESSLNGCIEDIMMTDGVEWVETNKNDMHFACTMETSRNLTLQQSAVGEQSIAEQIKEVACPYDCSSNGICNKGTCVCNDGFGGSDCSIITNQAVTLSGLLDRGLCDEILLPCDETYLFGGGFVESENLLCRLQPFIIDESGNRVYSDSEYIDAVYITLIEVSCPLRNQRRRRRSTSTDTGDQFVLGYTVSVANDGQTYADGEDLFIYNSECQLVQNISNNFHFFLKDGYCFIDNQCVMNGDVNSAENCSMCNTDISTRAWSFVNNGPDCIEPETTRTPFIPHDTEENSGKQITWIAGPIIAGIIIIVIAVCVFLKNKNKRAKMVSDSFIFADAPVMMQTNAKPKLNYNAYQE